MRPMSRLEQQMFYVRKRSDSNKCFMCESKATIAQMLVTKAFISLRPLLAARSEPHLKR
ncbi:MULTISPECIES: hypothetical protein [Lysinibacillus]|uniref:hypothetical protein n=1 Tax=Lysinibacillus TaxID=400634 RepID=UPI001585F80C|nr:hypothetical protein [Lysinibacillus xylanilyticus]